MVFGDLRYERLARISNGHRYNLRQAACYRRQVSQRRQDPASDGHLRIDSVHPGDLDGIKGIYLINAVDEVT